MKNLKKVFAMALLALACTSAAIANAGSCPPTSVNPATGQTCTLDAESVGKSGTIYCNYIC